MSRQFEDAKDTNETNHAKNGEGHRLVRFRFLFGEDREQCDEIWYNSDDINNVHHRFEKDKFNWTRNETNDELEGEPDDAACFNDEEWLGELGNIVLFDG